MRKPSALVLVTALAFLVVASGASAAPQISISPKWTASQLQALPGANWITTGGNIANQRYSSLNQVNTGNVSQLKEAWHTNLDGSGVAGKYSAEGTPLVHNGIMYIVTGNDDIFALDATNGAHLWTYHSGIHQGIDTICCGWDARGVALGEGMVFVAQLDGLLVAVDQLTGGVVWSRPNVNWREGYSQTASAQYYNGLIYTGMTGGEFGARGSMTAYDASTGKQVWRFYTCPTPGDFGGQTWPLDEWMTCGATIWNNPTIDPELGLMYFTTSNADPWAGRGPGTNLFSSSFVALDAMTGQYRWHYQVVHHDIWDYDCPSPTMLFDVTLSNGSKRKAIAESCKTGWTYILDRVTGMPIPEIDPIPEKKVKQVRANNTWATQPTPTGDSWAAQCPRARDWKGKKGPDGKKFTVGCIWTPINFNNFTVISPSAGGGNNWPPMSYDPTLNYGYVCSGDSANALKTDKNPFGKYKAGKTFLGVTFGAFLNWGGTFTAMNLGTNKKVWQKRYPEVCYSGSMTTAGGLVFMGRGGAPTFERGLGAKATTGGTGLIVAYNSATGDELFTAKTDAGANAPPMTYSVNGKQYVAIYAGGNTFNAPKSHGDSVYAYALP
jgi:PQQ-dependent dehydrogenase (methanol/ethanol family)